MDDLAENIVHLVKLAEATADERHASRLVQLAAALAEAREALLEETTERNKYDN